MTVDVVSRTTLEGLTTPQVAQRRAVEGFNELPAAARPTFVARIWRQLREPMAMLLLIAAAVAAFGLHEGADAAAILAIVCANVVIALIQEGKAARALEALRAMEAPVCTVVRDTRRRRIPARELVTDDLVILAAGDRVPADLRLEDARGAEVDEAILTGESLPVTKRAGDDAFAGTLLVRGAARGIVTQTGAHTALGEIAARLRAPEESTPLQRELRRVSARLGLIAVAIAIVVFALTIARSGDWRTSFLVGAALAVAAVPEGLPAVVTVALALGVRRMSTHGAIIRRLPAVETLGATTVILTDKTGTLTENRMRAEVVIPYGSFLEHVLALCNDATLDPRHGDPTELALLEAVGAHRVEKLRTTYPRRAEIPFDSDRRCMSTVHHVDGRTLVLTKGAPEAIFERCRPGNDLARTMMDKAHELAGTGARVLALAYRVLDADPVPLEDAERELTVTGVVALRDPVRAEARDTVAEARSAGIRIVMVTGDHEHTARYVADAVNIGEVRARVSPDEKFTLAAALQAEGEVVAVTGDGVNDAPALRRADIGVAMGRGSDVAREASDMIITDDNLATIVTAVREGRGIYDNIRKVVDYLVAGNLSEILVVVLGLLFFPALGVPLLPLQLLWVNLLTDGSPALALSVDGFDPGLMDRPPRARSDRFLAGAHLRLLTERAVLIAAAAIGTLVVERFVFDEPWPHGRAAMFTVLVIAHLLMAFVARAPRSGAAIAFNPWLLVAVVGGVGLQLIALTWGPATRLFGLAPLASHEWMLVAGAGALPAFLMRWAR